MTASLTHPPTLPIGGPAVHGDDNCHAVVFWWELEGSGRTVEDLRRRLGSEQADAPPIEGLLAKTWMPDSLGNRWGAVFLWESRAHVPGRLPPGPATELIGFPPTDRWSFDLALDRHGAGPMISGMTLGQ